MNLHTPLLLLSLPSMWIAMLRNRNWCLSFGAKLSHFAIDWFHLVTFIYSWRFSGNLRFASKFSHWIMKLICFYFEKIGVIFFIVFVPFCFLLLFSFIPLYCMELELSIWCMSFWSCLHAIAILILAAYNNGHSTNSHTITSPNDSQFNPRGSVI